MDLALTGLRAALASLLLVLLSACRSPGIVQGSALPSTPAPEANPAEWDWQLPAHCPPPSIPEDAPITLAMVELGRHLFYDARLSGDGTIACASCHVQALGFADPRRVSPGITGEQTRRNAMSLVNVAYARRLTWAHPTLDRLERQALIPLFGEEPVEMGGVGHEDEILSRINTIDVYASLASDAFGDTEPLSWNRIVTALATFQRAIVSCSSPYDGFVAGQTGAMSEAAVRGMELFFSERTECFHCHNGAMFSDSTTHVGAVPTDQAFHNTGLYNVDGYGAYPPDDPGLLELTARPEDMGRFRAPSLRNIALTAPYMHDGSIATLSEVIDHYAAGGRTIPDGPLAGAGSSSPLRSEFVPGFLVTDDEKSDLIAFLESLSDPTVATRASWSNPWPQ